MFISLDENRSTQIVFSFIFGTERERIDQTCLKAQKCFDRVDYVISLTLTLKEIYHGYPNYIKVVENIIVGVTVITGEITKYIGTSTIQTAVSVQLKIYIIKEIGLRSIRVKYK